jgi:hypothetical protein
MRMNFTKEKSRRSFEHSKYFFTWKNQKINKILNSFHHITIKFLLMSAFIIFQIFSVTFINRVSRFVFLIKFIENHWRYIHTSIYIILRLLAHTVNDIMILLSYLLGYDLWSKFTKKKTLHKETCVTMA